MILTVLLTSGLWVCEYYREKDMGLQILYNCYNQKTLEKRQEIHTTEPITFHEGLHGPKTK